MTDLWDEEDDFTVEPPTISKDPNSQPLPEQPLFLADDDDDDIDAESMFADLDKIAKDNERAIKEVEETIKSRQAKAKEVEANASRKRALDASSTALGAVKDDKDPFGDSSKDKDADGGKKARKPLAKVDDERLLGERGFPALIEAAKKFKPKGKGHEAADLERLMDLYQFWAHKMFPKTQFADTVQRVEKVARSKRLLINLSRWRDDDRHIEATEEHDIEGIQSDDASAPQQQPAASVSQNDSRPSSPIGPVRRTIVVSNELDLWADEEDNEPQSSQAPSESQQSSQPPPETQIEDDFQMDDLDDFDAWMAIDDDVPGGNQTGKSTASEVSANYLTDEEMHEAVERMEREVATSGNIAPKEAPTLAADVEDDLYV